jgi:acetylornithine/succinyldiaminopimelate/putrescine aminotransferase
VGHRHPKVVQAIKDQCDRYLHVIPYGEFVQEPQVRFAQALTAQLPESLNCAYFVNSGTEGIEAAIKLAKRITGRTRLVGCRKSYHGSTHGSLSLTDNTKKRFRNLPLLPDTVHITFNDPTDLDLITEEAACVVVEPVQGDAGVRIPDRAWMEALRARCTATGTMLVFDEVQTGFGRTGKLFAFEHFGTVPDILVLGKALGGGMPMGADTSPPSAVIRSHVWPVSLRWRSCSSRASLRTPSGWAPCSSSSWRTRPFTKCVAKGSCWPWTSGMPISCSAW